MACVYRLPCRLRSVQGTLVALGPRAAIVGDDEVVAERERGERRAGLPLGAERRRPAISAIEAPGLVGALECAVAAAPQQHVFSPPEDHQVHDVVAVDVDRVCPGDERQVGGPSFDAGERECASDRAPVAIQARGLGAPGEVQVGPAVGIAVEDGHAAADEELPLALVAVVDAVCGGFLDEARRRDLAIGTLGHGGDRGDRATNEGERHGEGARSARGAPHSIEIRHMDPPLGPARHAGNPRAPRKFTVGPGLQCGFGNERYVAAPERNAALLLPRSDGASNEDGPPRTCLVDPRLRPARFLEGPRSLQMRQVNKPVSGMKRTRLLPVGGSAGLREVGWLRTCLVGPCKGSLASGAKLAPPR